MQIIPVSQPRTVGLKRAANLASWSVWLVTALWLAIEIARDNPFVRETGFLRASALFLTLQLFGEFQQSREAAASRISLVRAVLALVVAVMAFVWCLLKALS